MSLIEEINDQQKEIDRLNTAIASLLRQLEQERRDDSFFGKVLGFFKKT